MHVAALEIHSYKSFLRTVILPFSPNLNIFIGPNNCGKTNVLDAIDFLTHPQKDPRRLHHHRAQLLLTLRLTAEEQELIRTTELVTALGRNYSVTMQDAHGQSLPENASGHLSSRIKMLTYDDFSDLERIEEDYTLMAERHPERFKQMTALLLEHFPEVKSINSIVDVDSDTYGTVAVGAKSITIERLGGGFRRVLVMLMYALHPDYSVVLIDEPEIHLHPGLIKRLLKIFNSGMTNQLIVTSHSPLFINAYTIPHVYRVLKDEQGSHVYSLAQQPGHLNQQRLVQEINADNMELFFADKVLLVEGVSDRILMRGLIDRFYTGPYDIKVIHTQGKTNIESYIELMRIFHIPYLVMLDRDALSAVAGQFGMHVGRHPSPDLYEQLRARHVAVLDNGSIEQNYPRRYQRKDSKPLNALHAAANITPGEYASDAMRNLRTIIDQL
ncbi:MAG: AAA family ATPase [Candidatus Komeilibacteria bacterium]|nr:AAA family ATPase [Candidatus Komeilibacteria bacterium]